MATGIKYNKATLIEELKKKIFSNESKAITGAKHQQAVLDMVESMYNPEGGTYAVVTYVDGVNGSDSTGEIGTVSPFKTIKEATQKSYEYLQSSGISEARGLVIVKKGTYTEDSITRTNVDMDFEMGSVTIASGNLPVIHDFTYPLNITITGKGQFYHTGYEPNNDKQAIATSNSNTTDFNFQGYEVDGIQNFGSTGSTFNYFDVRVRFDIDHHNNQTLNFSGCKFLSGFSSGHYLGNNVSVSIDNAEFILPSDNFTSLLDIKDYTGAIVDTISPVSLFQPLDTSSMTREEIRDYVPSLIIDKPMIAGIHHTSDSTPGASFANNYRLSITNSVVRVRKENCIGVNVAQNINVNNSVSNRGYILIKDLHIEDETTGKDITGVVTGKKTTITEELQLGLEYFTNATTKSDVIQATGPDGTDTGISYVKLTDVYSSGGTQNLQQVLDEGSTATSTTDVEVSKNGNSLFIGADANTGEPKVQLWHNRNNVDSSGNTGRAGLNSFGSFQYLGQNEFGEGEIWHNGYTQFWLTGRNTDNSKNITVSGLAGVGFSAQGEDTTLNENFNFSTGHSGFRFSSKQGSDRITLDGNTSAKGIVITEEDYGVETPGATLDIDGDLRIRSVSSITTAGYGLVLGTNNVVSRSRIRENNIDGSSDINLSPNAFTGATRYEQSSDLLDIAMLSDYEGKDGDPFFVRVKDNGTPIDISFDPIYFNPTFATLGTITTIANKWIFIEFRWNKQDFIWDCHDVKNEL